MRFDAPRWSRTLECHHIRNTVKMDSEVRLLQQQVAATEFLLQSLRNQLRAAEERAASREETNAPPSTRTAQSTSTSTTRNTGESSGNNFDANETRAATSQNGSVHISSETSRTAIPGAGSEENGDDEDAPGEESIDDAPAFALPSIEEGTTYPTLGDIKTAVTAHAISQGWTCGVHKRDKTRIVLRCRTGTDCPFHLRAEQYGEFARICTLKPIHSCSFQPDQSHIPRSHASSLQFLRQQLPTFMTVDVNTTSQEISDAIFKRFGTRVTLKQCRHLKPGPRRKKAPSVSCCSKCGGVGHKRTTCGRVSEPQQTP